MNDTKRKGKKPGERAMTQPRLSEQAAGWVI